jgi:hypothetical protein
MAVLRIRIWTDVNFFAVVPESGQWTPDPDLQFFYVDKNWEYIEIQKKVDFLVHRSLCF